MIATFQGKVFCPRCGADIGQEVTRDNAEFLDIGGMFAQAVTGICKTCGAGIHWEKLPPDDNEPEPRKPDRPKRR